MRFDLSHEVAWPARLVFETWRDRPGRLAAYLPRVDRIERLSTSQTSSGQVLQSRWVVPTSALPSLVQPLWRHETFSWTEHATWDAEALEMHWRQVPDRFGEAVHAEGSFRFDDDDDETIVWVEGHFELRLERLERRPPALGTIGADTLERALFEVLRPNFRMLVEGVSQLLDDEL